jgi:hypothetical protein
LITFASSLSLPPATATKRFFAAAQIKLHYAIHGQAAAGVIVDRADRKQENMGLTSWEGAPQGKAHKYDVAVAKNYLSEFELAQMQRIVSAYLDMAELQAMRRMPMTMADWEGRLGGFLKLWDREVFQDAGKVTAEIAKAHSETEFEKYRIVQDRLFESDFHRVNLAANRTATRSSGYCTTQKLWICPLFDGHRTAIMDIDYSAGTIRGLPSIDRNKLFQNRLLCSFMSSEK